MAHSLTTYPAPESGSALARRTTLGVFVAILVVLLLQAIVGALGVALGPTGQQSPFATTALLVSTVVAGIGASVVYAALVAFTDRPVRWFLGVAALVLVLSLAPIVVTAPSMGVTVAGQVVLAVYHLVVASSLVAAIVGAVDV